MRRLLVFVMALLIISYVGLYLTFEHTLKGPMPFLFEFLEGIIPWLLIIFALWGFRRGSRRRPALQRDVEGD